MLPADGALRPAADLLEDAVGNGAVALVQALEGARRVLLTGPVGPDGDSIGACLALQYILGSRGVSADVAGSPSYQYDWLPGTEEMITDAALGSYDAVVVMDGDRFRLTPGAESAFAGARVRGIVDHHGSTTPEGYTHPWLEPHATSTCEMVYDALSVWGVTLDETLATLLYVGAIFDTGGFRYGNTTPATHRMAAALLEQGIDHAGICTRVLIERRVSGLHIAGHVYGTTRLEAQGRLAVSRLSLADAERLSMVSGDLEGVVDRLVYTQGVEVAVLAIERAPGDVKLSLRSRGRVDVAAVAATLHPTGGGHPNAAGVCLAMTLEQAETAAIAAATVALDR